MAAFTLEYFCMYIIRRFHSSTTYLWIQYQCPGIFLLKEFHLFLSPASMPPAICLLLVTFVGCNTELAVALLTLGTMFVGGMYSGFLANHIDIAPPFAGTLMGITNTFATVPGIIVPSFVGFITHNNVSNVSFTFSF